jgi:hypothetical protein
MNSLVQAFDRSKESVLNTFQRPSARLILPTDFDRCMYLMMPALLLRTREVVDAGGGPLLVAAATAAAAAAIAAATGGAPFAADPRAADAPRAAAPHPTS